MCPCTNCWAASAGDPVEVYATALYPEATRAAVEKAEKLAERGFHGIKIKVGFDLPRTSRS